MINKNSLSIPLKIKTKTEIVETQALLDSGAGGEFIDQNYTKTLNLPLKTLDKLIPTINVDGTLNKKGTIKHYINLELKILGQSQTIQLLVTGLGKQKNLLGFPWLQKNNPVINWQDDTFQPRPVHIPQKFDFRKKAEIFSAKPLPKPTVIDEEDQDEWMTRTINVLGTDCRDALICSLIEIKEQIIDKGAWINPETNSVWICSKATLATDLAIVENLKKDNLTDEQIVPPEYHKFLDIFDKKRASQFPDKRPWDHKIDMKPDFELKLFKNYNLTSAEKSNWTTS